MVITDDFYEMLLGKLVANAVINPLTAILSVENGQLIDNLFYFNVFQDLFEEIADILELNNRDAYFQQVVEICRKTEDNRSSMLKDIEAKRMTEVDAILGFVVGEAKKKKKQGPLTESFFHLLKGKEQNREGLN
ncbi:ketopantoate reductase C-terminal domain-containing protein [Neobacillus sp. PS3-34]|uniref:ketopantoate reductase family protein n=1 Tax=Neobacillus sp. PS3-34 TaxID=3070678 RepID=UPI0027E116D0|nr:ketopantoate reductase C-terminal domain-containing protein [Neobacillus sp. PS3-34]WML49350.1 ketopantoate reductase C-terminal domain-containing protein [Neobacillus sp. PS3-34]